MTPCDGASETATATMETVADQRRRRPPPTTVRPVSSRPSAFHHCDTAGRRFPVRRTILPQRRENASGGRFRPKLEYSGHLRQGNRTTPIQGNIVNCAVATVATDDRVNEAVGFINLIVMPDDGYTLGNRSSATASVEDYDVPEFSVVAAAIATEGNSATLFR